jgi:tetratricopeptide (TPR) repeat protein
MYAFNHDEAIRSFTQAAVLDPECAMAWWGIALCQGPNYNDPVMTEARSKAAWDALREAQARIGNTTPAERALIEALAHRYASPEPEDRTHLERAYAVAMAEVWAANPNDSDVGTLYAEAMMVKTPWMLYSLDFEPAEDTPAIVSVLERVLEMDPDNPGANHLYIHAVEPSADPDRGLAAAARLNDMVPASGHLLHMPSHIYVKTGRWDEAVTQNVKAMDSDATYCALSPDQGIQYVYQVHNAHMLAYAAMMSGREQEAMTAARAMWANIPEPALREVGPIFDRWMSSVYDVQKRFGRWDDIIAEPPPPDYLPVTTAIWRAHRAIAYAARKDFPNAEREYGEFRKVMDTIPADHLSDMDLTHRVLKVSDDFILGEIALQQGDWDRAAELLEKAAEVEDTLSYGEPPQWLQPVRHTLGAVYLKAGRYEDAERAYREDLAKWRNNGWSLYGLSRALEGQAKTAQARAVDDQYRRAWARADALTRTSCKCIPET